MDSHAGTDTISEINSTTELDGLPQAVRKAIEELREGSRLGEFGHRWQFVKTVVRYCLCLTRENSALVAESDHARSLQRRAGGELTVFDTEPYERATVERPCEMSDGFAAR